MNGKTFSLPEFNYEVVIGKFAGQADGAVWFKQGGTVVFSTVVSQPTTEFPGFLPLTVDYREQFSAAGKIPGGYFKREGRSTEKEILTSRLVDRAIRPLFPSNYFDQIQALSTVYSVDKEHMPQTLALLATSIALSISSIPFMGPVGVVEVARVDGKWIYMPTYQQSLDSDVRIIVAGTEEGVNMVEGSMQEISEKELIDVLFNAHDIIKKQVSWQKEIIEAVGKEKQVIQDFVDWQALEKDVAEFITAEKVRALFAPDKIEFDTRLKALQDEFLGDFEHKQPEEIEISEKILRYVFDNVLQKKITDQIFETGKRIDGRPFDQVRPIDVEVSLLPFTHGSAMFKRGRTQALATVTLGGGQDEQKVEDLMGNTIERSFMLHYNFPPFSVGDVRPMRGPGRREVGHGSLAASAIEQVLPSKQDFPYTIRIVVDILESNGSSSMATVCASTMALLSAGVPIKRMVSGIAMGLIMSPDGDFQALTDINGKEDAFGLMDFKVTGTDKGITAIQMDIKYKGGLARSVFEKALDQAKHGREHILKEMQKVMDKPSEKLSDLVPRVITFKVPTDKIGAIIGSGGKVIRDIIDKTETSIDIDDDGTVKVYGHPGPKMDQAESWVKILGGKIETGKVYTGLVKRVADFGVFVELAPGHDGLMHISNIPREMQKTLAKEFPIDSVIDVKILDYDASTGRTSLKFVEKKTNK